MVQLRMISFLVASWAATVVSADMFKVAMHNFWSADKYAMDYPATAHYSKFIVAVHNQSTSVFGAMMGQMATSCVETLAETGKSDDCTDMLNMDMSTGKIKAWMVHGPGPMNTNADEANGLAHLTMDMIDDLEITAEYPHFEMMSMLAPSSD
jgi:hypothetical protein